MADTIRERILAAMKTSAEAIVEGQDGYLLEFPLVTREDIGLRHERTFPALGIYDGPGQKLVQTNQRTPTLLVTLDARTFVPDGKTQSEVGNELLGQIQKWLYENQQFGGLTLKADDRANEIDIDSHGDRWVQVSVWVELLYRHGLFDPTITVG